MQETYRISGHHAIDQRCYFNDVENAYGLGMGVLDVTYDVPKDVMENFWSHAKKYHMKFKDQQSRKTSIEHPVIEKLTGQNPFFLIDSEGLDSPPPKIGTYGTTNMRDVTKLIGKCGDNVDLIYYDRFTSVQEECFIWLSTIQTFNGQLMHSMQYNTQYIEESLAKKIAQSTFKILREVVDQP
ncbi:uncharacterized protein LOC125178255 [Hyalella azteca]|uniref:Uncharacterized protein LOC125178255 n=1 Tax=Hyalella azteca TaxID=294128 RepID=A0A979FKJ9_HYAAZ|nr:uncharacterized protein LOC125178255 [Hyalella azteca]